MRADEHTDYWKIRLRSARAGARGAARFISRARSTPRVMSRARSAPRVSLFLSAARATLRRHHGLSLSDVPWHIPPSRPRKITRCAQHNKSLQFFSTTALRVFSTSITTERGRSGTSPLGSAAGRRSKITTPCVTLILLPTEISKYLYTAPCVFLKRFKNLKN